MTVAIFFLARDRLRFGGHFYVCAAFCGLAAMTKGIGFYFFLSVAVYLVIGFVQKKASFRRLALSAAGFLLVMAAVYFISNPILVYPEERQRFFEIMREQSALLTSGYELQYATGLAAALPALREYYGSLIFLLAGLAVCVWSAVRGHNRLLGIIILAWVIPLSVLDIFIIHFKFQYWLPVALPLFSTFAAVLPDKADFDPLRSGASRRAALTSAFRLILTGVLLTQMVFFIAQGLTTLGDQLHRSERSSSIAFYSELQNVLSPLPQEAFQVYYDPRVYVPASSGWVTNTPLRGADLRIHRTVRL